MATNLALDDELLRTAQAIGGFTTKKETVTRALEEFIQRHTTRDVIGLFGTIDYEADYDYKARRQR
jgi:Arc/MetJ family transcription regulator